MPATHDDVIKEVIRRLRALPLAEFGVRDVVELDYPFNNKTPPAPCLVVSLVSEVEQNGLNNISDMLYPVQVLRTGHSLDNRGGVPRTSWRNAVREEFNHTRMGLEGEVRTKVEFMEMQYDAAWKSYNLDSSGLRILTTIRIPI